MNAHTADDVPRPTSPPPTPFLSSPHVYILVVGVLAVVPVVFGIVMCKKARERKSKIHYARGKQPFSSDYITTVSTVHYILIHSHAYCTLYSKLLTVSGLISHAN